MSVAWSAVGALAALPAATVLRGRVYRLSVSGGAELEACLTCAGPLPGWPALRCWSCGTWLGVPAAIEITAAAVTALLVARFWPLPALAAFAYLGLIGVALAQVDGAVRRLPDRLTLPAYPALILLLGLAAAAGQDGGPLLRAVAGALALGGGYLLVGLASGGQVGGGDIKLAGLVGLALGWLGWRALITGACLGFVLGGAVAVAMLATRHGGRRSAISFGPYMLAGALLAALAGGAH